MENDTVSEETLDKTGFVRNVNVGGVWKQITISPAEREAIQKRLLEEQASVYMQAWRTVRQAYKDNKIMPLPGEMHSLAMQMTERTTPHIHMVYQNYLEQKAKRLQEQINSPIESEPEPVAGEMEAEASVSPAAPRFEEKNGELYINGKKVLKAWESYNGWYWFATEKVREQESLIDGKAGKDTIWFGLVQGFEEEWGNFSQAEIESLGSKAWEIPKMNLPYSGRCRAEAQAYVSTG